MDYKLLLAVMMRSVPSTAKSLCKICYVHILNNSELAHLKEKNVGRQWMGVWRRKCSETSATIHSIRTCKECGCESCDEIFLEQFLNSCFIDSFRLLCIHAVLHVSNLSCTPSFLPPLVILRSLLFIDRWIKLDSVCFGTKNNQYGSFNIPYGGKTAAVALHHLSGYVTCAGADITHWSFWGCGSHIVLKNHVNVVITTSSHHAILPLSQFFTHGGYNRI